MKINKNIILLLFLMVFTGCNLFSKDNNSPTSSTSNQNTDFLYYEDSTIIIKYHNTWVCMGEYPYFVQSKTKTLDNNITVRVSYIPYEVEETVDKYAADYKESLFSHSNYHLIAYSFSTLSGNKAYKMVYSRSEYPTLKYLEIGTVSKKNIYKITCESGLKEYDDSIWIVEEMIKSFIIK